MVTTDAERIFSVLSRPEVYEPGADDTNSAPELEHIQQVVGLPNILFLMPTDGILFVLVWSAGVIWGCHTNVIPEKRGVAALTAGREAIDFMFSSTGCRKLMGMTPVYNRAAMIFNRRLGFVREGLVTQSFLKNGTLHDQVLFGLTEEAWQH